MSPRVVSSRSLEDRHDRACARLSYKATMDTLTGRASALVIARRMAAMKSKVPALEIVSEAYSSSTGRASRVWRAFECPECGQAWLGYNAAALCCSI